MGEAEVFNEMVPLSSEDCFIIKKRTKTNLAYPLHTHKEFELNYLENAKGALRIVADSKEEMDDLDLVLVAGDVQHAYVNHKHVLGQMTQITVQFQASLFDSLIEKRHFKSIKEMFQRSSAGLVFSHDIVQSVQNKLKEISNDTNHESFTNFLRLIDVLKFLSLDSSARCLNQLKKVPVEKESFLENDRKERIMNYLSENYQNRITLSELADFINMSEASLIRFFKKWTGKTFIENLNEIRIEEAVYRLVNTSDSISEICYKCGFNNLSNFNRVFKKIQRTTPTIYREKYIRTKFNF